MSESDTPPLYVLRFTEGFFADLRNRWEHFRETAGENIADEWEESLLRALNKVRENPYACPVATEYDRFSQSVRRLLHQRVPGAPTYRVLFFLAEPERKAEVNVVPIVVFAALHASAKPLAVRKASRTASSAIIPSHSLTTRGISFTFQQRMNVWRRHYGSRFDPDPVWKRESDRN